MLQKLGISHDVKSFAIGSFLEYLVVRIANDYFSSKHLTRSSNQRKTDRFLVKFALKIPMKLAIFNQLFCSKISPENFCESVSQNPVKFDFCVTYQIWLFENIAVRSWYKFGGKLALFMWFGTFFMMKAKQDKMKCLFYLYSFNLNLNHREIWSPKWWLNQNF